MDFEPMSIRFEPTPNVFVFVVGGIVLNQHGAAPTIAATELLQESSVSGCVEHGVLRIVKTSALQVNRAKDLHVLTFPGNRDFGRATNPTPCRMECRILPEAGFVGEYQRPVLRARFFLIAGYVYRCQRSRALA